MEWTRGAGVSPCRPARSGLDLLCGAIVRRAGHFALAFICRRTELPVSIQIIRTREDRNGFFAYAEDRRITQTRIHLHGSVRVSDRKGRSARDGRERK